MAKGTPQPGSRGRKRGLRWLLTLIVLLATAGSLTWYLNSRAFSEYVRTRLIKELENATGGRVDLKAFRWHVSTLEIEADDLTIHGLEPEGQAPYAHVDRLYAKAKVLSFLEARLGLRVLELDRPSIHIIVNPDGSTNQPVPKEVRQTGGTSTLEDLFTVEADHLEIREGVLLWNERRLPLDLSATQASVSMDYVAHDADGPNYKFTLRGESIDTKYGRSPNELAKAELKAALFHDKLRIDSLEVSSGAAQLQARGQLIGFHSPRIDLAYQAAVGLRDLGEFIGVKQLRAGTAEISGTGRYEGLDRFESSGKLQLKDAAWSDSAVRVSDVTAASEFALDAHAIRLQHIFARGVGGSAAGELSIQDWLRADASGRKQQGTAHFQVAGSQLSRVLDAVATRDVPVNKLGLAATVSGKVDLRWRDSASSVEALADLTLNAPASAASGQLPASGSLRGSYRAAREQIEIEQFNLNTPQSKITAFGILGSGIRPDAQLRVSLTSGNIAELEPAFQALGADLNHLPVLLHGSASFNGNIAGRLAAPTISGHVEAANLETLLTAFTKAEAGAIKPSEQAAKAIRWDTLVADVLYSPTGLSIQGGRLLRGSSSVELEGSLALVKGAVPDDAPIKARLSIQNGDATELQSLLGYSYPVSGTTNAHASVSGSLKHLNGNGRVDISGGSLYGRPFKSLGGDIAFTGQQARVTDLDLREDGATVQGSASYDFASHGIGFQVTGKNFDIVRLLELPSDRFKFTGKGEFTAAGSGTTEQPIVNATLRFTGLTFNGERSGDVVVTARTRGAEMHVDVESRAQNASLAGTGDIRLRDDFPGEIRFRLDKLDFDPVIQAAMPGRITSHSTLSGDVVVKGPFRNPRQLVVTANFPELTANMENYAVRNEGPVRITVSQAAAQIEAFHLVGEGTDLTVTGTVQLGGARQLNLRADGKANLKLAQSFYHDLVSYGISNLTVRVGGTVQQPQLTGNIQFVNAGLAFIDLPNGLSEINGSLVFNQNRLEVQQLSARTGGGRLQIGGYVSYRNNLFFNLTATGRDIRIRYPQGVSSQANADLRLTGSVRNPLISGDVTILRFGLTEQFDLAFYLAQAKQQTAPPSPDSLVDKIRLDVHVVSTPQLQFESSLAKLSGDVDLRLRGTVARPVLLGGVHIAEGDILFNATRYHLERGDITFANPVTIDPVINVEASATVSGYDITLGFHGSPSRTISTTYRSEPPLPSADIIALLALGRTQEETAVMQETAQQASFTQSASDAVLGQALNAVVSSRIQRLFGISRIKIDPGLSSTDNRGTSVTIEQQISNKVTLTYSTNLQQNQQQVVQVEYNVNRNVSIVAVRDQTGVFGLDVRVRQRKR